MPTPTSATTDAASLRDSVDALTQGLGLMLEMLGTHTEMLRTIVKAATAEPGESPIPDLLTKMAEQMTEQTAILRRLDAARG